MNKNRLEPAIPEHLRTERTQPLRSPKGFIPTSPSYSARFDPSVSCLPMLYVGIQFKQRSSIVETHVSKLTKFFSASSGPGHWDQAEYVDKEGFATVIFAAYWNDKSAFEQWQAALDPLWWIGDIPLHGDVGVFKEAYSPGILDTETTFSHREPEGYSKLAAHMSHATDTHQYWGSARDRIPRSQTDALKPSGMPSSNPHQSSESLGNHIIVRPHQNLCLLRSGQDWTRTVGDERVFYLDRVHPILIDGMTMICEAGLNIGCIYNRFMTHEEAGSPIEKTYSLSAWESLSDLENWAANHSSHLAIFHIGIKHYKKAGSEAQLRLYHEMFVLRSEDQSYEYYNCHPKTGMLNACRE